MHYLRVRFRESYMTIRVRCTSNMWTLRSCIRRGSGPRRDTYCVPTLEVEEGSMCSRIQHMTVGNNTRTLWRWFGATRINAAARQPDVNVGWPVEKLPTSAFPSNYHIERYASQRHARRTHAGLDEDIWYMLWHLIFFNLPGTA